MKPIVVLPTYNEAENLPEVVAQIRRQPGGCHILIVDDSSPDGTGAIADGLSARFPGEVFVLHRARKEGLGRAYVDAFRHVLKLDYDIVVQMDADLSHSPGYLPALLREIERCDLVLGSRYLGGVHVVNWAPHRLLLSRLAGLYARLVTGMKFTDVTGGFKCWRRETLQAINLEGVFSNGYLFQIETTYRAHRRGFRIAETSIVFYERHSGRSKIDFGVILEAFLGVIRMRLRRPR